MNTAFNLTADNVPADNFVSAKMGKDYRHILFGKKIVDVLCTEAFWVADMRLQQNEATIAFTHDLNCRDMFFDVPATEAEILNAIDDTAASGRAEFERLTFE